MIVGQKAIWKYNAGESVISGTIWRDVEVTIKEIADDYITVETEDGSKHLACPECVREI